MTKNRNITLWFLLAFLGVSTVGAQDYELKSQQVDTLFTRYGVKTPGVAIRVLKDGRVIHQNEYGMANLEHEVPITSSSVFPIGSVSKQFTGMAIAMLAEQGKIDLDADVRTYVPDVPDFGAIITIRHLLHHQSGIRDWVRPFVFAGWHAGDVIDFGQVMEFLRRQKELNFTPGEDYMYSNTGYVLLAEVVQRATETSYPEWMRENIFEPLGMTSARVRGNYYDFIKNLADSYYPIGEGYGPVPSGLTAYGSCCIVTVIDDMVKWVRNFETAEVGGADLIRQMQEDKVEIKEWDRLVGYGYGLMHFDYHGHRGLFHSGQWVGYRACILYVPDERFAVIALGNAGPSVNLREWDILDLYLGNRLPVTELEESPDSATKVPVDSVTLDQYVGAYNLGSGEIVTVTHDTSGLLAGFASDPGPHPLTAVSNTEFQFRADGDTMRFEPGNAGLASGLYWRGDYAPRVEPFNPTAEELHEFTGTFYSEEIEATMRFLVRDDQLVARHIRWGKDVPFTPTIQDEFRGRRQITQARFVRDADNRITEMVLSGRRAYNLRFFKLEGLLGSDPLPR